jgi:hypothetical protein
MGHNQISKKAGLSQISTKMATGSGDLVKFHQKPGLGQFVAKMVTGSRNFNRNNFFKL